MITTSYTPATLADAINVYASRYPEDCDLAEKLRYFAAHCRALGNSALAAAPAPGSEHAFLAEWYCPHCETVAPTSEIPHGSYHSACGRHALMRPSRAAPSAVPEPPRQQWEYLEAVDGEFAEKMNAGWELHTQPIAMRGDDISFAFAILRRPVQPKSEVRDA